MKGMSQRSEIMNESLQSTVAEYFASFGNEAPRFKPFACYDKHLDCIRVQIFDCSFKEERKNQFITVLHANHTSNGKLAGFNIKGVRYIFKRLGLSDTGVYKIADILDSLVKIYPDAAFKHVQNTFRPILKENDLSIEVEWPLAA